MKNKKGLGEKMINVYNQGPYINIFLLLSGSIQEIGQYSASFLICTLYFWAVKRFLSGFLKKAAIFMLSVLQIYYVYSVSIKRELIFSLSLAILIALQLRILRLLAFQAEDYVLMFCLTLFPNRLFNNTSALIGNLWLFVIIFFSLYVSAKINIKCLKGNHFSCYFLFVILSLSSYIFHLSCTFMPYAFQNSNDAAPLMITIMTTLLVLLLATLFIRYKFYDQLLRLNNLGKKYQNIEKYFPGFSALILLLFILILVPFSVLQLHNFLIMLLLPCLCLAILYAQLPFIVLLFKTAFYKDAATYQQWEKEEISSYYQNLSSSLSDIQGMRHDIKNIFFTMGNFVNESDNQDMKDFFWEKIYPYSQKTISQSELLSKLYQIPSESLRAFLNLKVSQAMEHGATVNLDVCISPENFRTAIDIIDLTRILGILLDNAIEETTKIPNGIIEIGIRNNETSCSYIIKNSLTPQTQQTGIHIGQTTKGNGHGKGLLIIQQLIAQYPNAVLNTSIYQSTYIQCLNIS